jgi:hypothetical protein
MAALPKAAAEQTRAMWVWDAPPLLHDAAARSQFLAFCTREGIGRAWIQVGADDGARLRDAPAWRVLLADAHASGLAIDALDGSPAYAQPEQHAEALNVVNAVIAYNRSTGPASRFDGIHMDNEPYLLPGWQHPARREWLLRNLLELSTAIKASTAANGLAFGVDIPFWWHAPDPETGQAIGDVTFNDRRKPASFHLLDLADQVGIMDYRNHAEGSDGLIAHAEPLLSYAEASGATVFVGIETAAAQLPKLTFFSQTREHMAHQLEIAERAFRRFRSYTGVAIHDYTGYRMLAGQRPATAP